MTKDQLKHVGLLALTGALGAIAAFFSKASWSWAPLVGMVMSALVTRLDKIAGTP